MNKIEYRNGSLGYTLSPEGARCVTRFYSTIKRLGIFADVKLITRCNKHQTTYYTLVKNDIKNIS